MLLQFVHFRDGQLSLSPLAAVLTTTVAIVLALWSLFQVFLFADPFIVAYAFVAWVFGAIVTGVGVLILIYPLLCRRLAVWIWLPQRARDFCKVGGQASTWVGALILICLGVLVVSVAGLVSARKTSVEIAQEELRSRGLDFSRDALQNALYFGNDLAVELFMQAGVDIDELDRALGQRAEFSGGRALLPSLLQRNACPKEEEETEECRERTERIVNLLALRPGRGAVEATPRANPLDRTIALTTDAGAPDFDENGEADVESDGKTAALVGRPLLSYALETGAGHIAAELIARDARLLFDADWLGEAALKIRPASRIHNLAVVDPFLVLTEGDWTPAEKRALLRELCDPSGSGLRPLSLAAADAVSCDQTLAELEHVEARAPLLGSMGSWFATPVAPPNPVWQATPNKLQTWQSVRVARTAIGCSIEEEATLIANSSIIEHSYDKGRARVLEGEFRPGTPDATPSPILFRFLDGNTSAAGTAGNHRLFMRETHEQEQIFQELRGALDLGRGTMDFSSATSSVRAAAGSDVRQTAEPPITVRSRREPPRQDSKAAERQRGSKLQPTRYDLVLDPASLSSDSVVLIVEGDSITSLEIQWAAADGRAELGEAMICLELAEADGSIPVLSQIASETSGSLQADELPTGEYRLSAAVLGRVPEQALHLAIRVLARDPQDVRCIPAGETFSSLPFVPEEELVKQIEFGGATEVFCGFAVREDRIATLVAEEFGAADIDLALLPLKEGKPGDQIALANQTGNRETLNSPKLREGSYALRIFAASGSTSTLRLRAASEIAPDDPEGDDREGAYELDLAQLASTPSETSAKLSAGDSGDWFRFHIAEQIPLDFSLREFTGDLDFEIFGDDSDVAVQSATSSDTGIEQKVGLSLEPGGYYMRVYSYTKQESGYSLRIAGSAFAPTPDRAEAGGSPADSLGRLSSGEIIQLRGTVGAGGRNGHRIVLDEAGTITVLLEPVESDVDVELLKESGEEVSRSYNVQLESDQIDAALQPGVYQVDAVSAGQPSAYRLTISRQ